MQKEFADVAKHIQHLIEWSFSASKTRKVILDAATDAVLLGVGFYRSFFQAPDYEKVTKAQFENVPFESEAVYP
ncbi:MAG: hypothetical protein NZZ41_02810 [Candidatus Dojkabacteria bacterium]|nr:hypothetical protein [Candidatus Dojkabacteria bacterium]